MKLAIAGTAALAAVAVLVALAAGGTTVYYYTVGELIGRGRADGVRVAGQLVPGSLAASATPGGATTFRLQDAGHTENALSIRHTGALPDAFQEGMAGDVVGEGGYDGAGGFAAATILAKCPSKYERAAEEKVDALEEAGGGE